MTRLSLAAARRFYKKTGQAPPHELRAKPKVAAESQQDGSDGEVAFAYYWGLLASDLPKPVREWKVPEDKKRRKKSWEETFRADFAWPNNRVIFEVQGSGHQMDRERYRSDLIRHGLLTMWGYRVIYATPDQIADDPDRWIGILRTMLRPTIEEIEPE